MRKRAVGWVTPCKWIIQESHRIVALHSRPLSEEQAGGDSWRLELAFFIDLITHREWEDRDTEVWMYQNVLCVCTQVLLHRSVMFKWECRVIFLSSVFLFFLCSRVASSCYMSEGADSSHFPELSPWCEGHTLGRGRFAHFLFSSPSLLLYTHSASLNASVSPFTSIDRLTDLSLWKINRTTFWVLVTLIFHGR